MRKTTLLILFIYFHLSGFAQISLSESFDNTSDNNLPVGWSTNNSYFSTGSNSCSGRSVRDNLHENSTEGILTSPLVGSLSSGTSISFQFQYKIVDYFTFGTPVATSPGWGSLTVEYTINGGDSWNEVLIIDDTNHTPSNSCQTINAVIPGENVPSGSDFQLRFRGNWQQGDYFIYIDNIILNQIVFSVPNCDASLISPQNGEADAPLDGEISWSVATGGTVAYRFSMGTSPGATDVVNQAVVSGGVTSYDAGQLEEGTTYYVRIISFNSLGNASGCTEYSFTTGFLPCSDASELVVSEISQTSAQLIWEENGSSTEWKIIYGPTNFDIESEGFTYIDNDGVSNETLNVFSPETTYDVFVQSYCENTDTYSEVIGPVTFTTLAEIPENDACSSAEFIDSMPFSTEMNANGATNNNGFITVCGGLGMNDGVWYSFVGDGYPITITVEETTDWNSEIGLYSGSCNNLSCVESVDTEESIQQIVFNSQEGENYFINIGVNSGTNNALEGAFELEISTLGPPPCAEPSAIIIQNIESNSASLSWSENGEANQWEVYYGLINFDPETEGEMIVVENEPQVTLPNLVSSTTYGVYIKSICEFNESDLIGPVNFITQTQICADPTNLSISNITETSAEVSWVENGAATEWLIVYGTPGFDPAFEGVEVIDNDGVLGETLTGLEAGTYEVYVYSICSESVSNISEPEVFSTANLSTQNHLFNTFKYYPNPVNSTLNLEANSRIDRVEIYNITGKKIYSNTIGSLTHQLDVSFTSAGIYLMKVYIEDQEKTFKLIKN
ncbi:T9SS type A sorting domain-containing protein [Mesonia mobilis]|mgnify:CR=1 FL=1|uniref:T9SS type A sorting domain-containing protein n=2 Tax=Mesonia mobilis TaxID=369791 RepID=UPI0026EE89E2|nr:T9SS type A sorting domain-containing protein [Mesonia mobilis]